MLAAVMPILTESGVLSQHSHGADIQNVGRNGAVEDEVELASITDPNSLPETPKSNNENVLNDRASSKKQEAKNTPGPVLGFLLALGGAGVTCLLMIWH